MASRDIWSRAGTLQVRDLLASLLGARLLAAADAQPLYICSPYLTDFPLFDNAFGQFQPLFRARPDIGDHQTILFSEALAESVLPRPRSDHRCSWRVRRPLPALHDPRRQSAHIRPLRFRLHHEKGLLCAAFYIEGSMNFTYSGVYRRDEKITAHTPDTTEGRQKIAAATLEFKRLWEAREDSEISRSP